MSTTEFFDYLPTFLNIIMEHEDVNDSSLIFAHTLMIDVLKELRKYRDFIADYDEFVFLVHLQNFMDCYDACMKYFPKGKTLWHASLTPTTWKGIKVYPFDYSVYIKVLIVVHSYFFPSFTQ